MLIHYNSYFCLILMKKYNLIQIRETVQVKVDQQEMLFVVSQ